MPALETINSFTSKTKLRLTDFGYVLGGDGISDFTLAFRQAVMEAAEAFSPHKGLLMSWVSNTSFSVGTGVVGDSTGVEGIRIASALTKTTAVWAAGSAVGGLDAGAIAVSTWYYVYVIKALGSENAADTTDVLFSTSATSPTMPTGYTLKRIIGAVKTNASSQFIQFIGYEDGTQAWVTVLADVSTAALGAAKTNFTLLSAPPIKALIELYAVGINVSVGTQIQIYGDTNLADVASGTSPVNSPLSTQVTNVPVTAFIRIICIAGILYARSNAASTTLAATCRSFNVRPFN